MLRREDVGQSIPTEKMAEDGRRAGSPEKLRKIPKSGRLPVLTSQEGESGQVSKVGLKRRLFNALQAWGPEL